MSQHVISLDELAAVEGNWRQLVDIQEVVGPQPDSWDVVGVESMSMDGVNTAVSFSFGEITPDDEHVRYCAFTMHDRKVLYAFIMSLVNAYMKMDPGFTARIQPMLKALDEGFGAGGLGSGDVG